jgi:hypothetical protein
MPAPFLSYLRVYEPLRAFDGPGGAAVRAALRRGGVEPAQAGRRERAACLRAQLGRRLLPSGETDVLVTEGPDGPLVCPLDTRARAGAAVLGFLAEESGLLANLALPWPERAARRQAQAAMAELGDGAAHVVSASWTVPLPWFALVDPDGRNLTLEPRRVWWRVPMWRARGRAAWAERTVRDAVAAPTSDPSSTATRAAGAAEVLAETGRWLERFDRSSLVELDYGGVVDLLDDDALRADRSAQEVRAALAALRAGDPDLAGACYERLREFWAVPVAKQSAS